MIENVFPERVPPHDDIYLGFFSQADDVMSNTLVVLILPPEFS